MATNSTADHAIAQGAAPPQNPAEYREPDHSQAAQSAIEQVEVKCGPLLNYRSTSNANSEHPRWHGSVLIVTQPGVIAPTLNLLCTGPVNDAPADLGDGGRASIFNGQKLYEDKELGFWRFLIDLPLQSFEARWEYHIPGVKYLAEKKAGELSTFSFCVPAASQSMRIMFHSCNGFSVGTDEDAYSGTPLWNDVLRQHAEKPIHVMLGGGDQIYNDGIRVSGPLRPWTDISNPKKRRDFPFDHEMRTKCDEWYARNYLRWYNTEPFATANGQIPQVNIWDDHDIIDGFGSYTHHFMQCPVFRGIGGVAHKYYLLFQHHLAPPMSTFTTDVAPQPGMVPNDPEQLQNSYVMAEEQLDSCYIIGQKAGPYVEEHSHSVLTQLGAHVLFLGIDARTERTRHQINYPETYRQLFAATAQKLEESGGKIKHLILLLGVPIAYPRLQWLENILTSPVIGPIRLMNKRFGLAGGLFNKFDGGVDILDDLDDHYTAHAHKKERKELVLQLQELASKYSVRITILGGDVHLAALGRFYSNPRLDIAPEHDCRYMVNIVSSAITNKPPPQAIANLLARRNKIHHLDGDTDETLLYLFDKDPSEVVHHPVQRKAGAANHATMPSRNYALITESHDLSNPQAVNDGATTSTNTDTERKRAEMKHHNHSRKLGNPRNPLHDGEDNCGTAHPAADSLKRTGLCGQYGLDVCIHVEIDQHDAEGKTVGYGISIPALEALKSGE